MSSTQTRSSLGGSTKKITKSNLHKPTESAKQRVRLVPEKPAENNQWNQSTNPKLRVGEVKLERKPSKLKIDVQSKLDKPTLSSQYKEKEKYGTPPTTPSSAAKTTPISQHSRLVCKTTKSLIAASVELHQKIAAKPITPSKPFSPAGTALRTTVSDPVVAKQGNLKYYGLDSVHSRLYAPTNAFLNSKYVPPPPETEEIKPLPGQKANLDVRSRLYAPTQAFMVSKYTPPAKPEQKRVRRVLQRSYSDTDLLAGAEDEENPSIRVKQIQDDIDFTTPRMTKLALQRLAHKENVQHQRDLDITNSSNGSPSHAAPGWDSGINTGSRIPSPSAFQKSVPLTPEERKIAMMRLLKPNAATLAAKYVKPPPPENPEPKDFVVAPIVREMPVVDSVLHPQLTPEERKEAMLRLTRPNAAAIHGRWVASGYEEEKQKQLRHQRASSAHVSSNRSVSSSVSQSTPQRARSSSPPPIVFQSAPPAASTGIFNPSPQRYTPNSAFRAVVPSEDSDRLKLIQPVAIQQTTPAYNLVAPMPISPLRGQPIDASSTPSTPVIIQIESTTDALGQHAAPRTRKPPLPILSLTTLSATKSQQNLMEVVNSGNAPSQSNAQPYPVVNVAATASSAAAAAAAAAAGALELLGSPVQVPVLPRSTPVVKAADCANLSTIG